MAKSPPEYAMEMLEAVLLERRVSVDDVRRLVEHRVPEGLYLEYKRGLWMSNADVAREVRRYVTGFANAEGGLLIIGLIGGEDAQGDQRWSFESPACPDRSGWDAWLSRTLQHVAVSTIVRWQVVSLPEGDCVLIATSRSEALARVYEKPSLVGYLRVGDQTIPMGESLFADLALGRRMRPELEIGDFKVQPGTDSSGSYINLSVTVRNRGLLWVPDVAVVFVGYAARMESTSRHLLEQLEIRPPEPEDRSLNVCALEGAPTRPTGKGEQELKPFGAAPFAMKFPNFPSYRGDTYWVWAGAVVVVPKNAMPLWVQLVASGVGNDIPHSGIGWSRRIGRQPSIFYRRGADRTLGPRQFFDDFPSSS